MERVFGKSFIFAVDSYEVWRNQKCVDENNTDGEIIGIPYDNSMYFAYIGLTNGVTYKPFKTNLNSINSQMLKAEECSLIREDRIQYYNDEFCGDDEPYLCHIFCNYGRINYIRFAMAANNSNVLFPAVDKIYEYYGDMIELDNFSEDFIEKIDLLCKQMVSTIPINRYTISFYDSDDYNIVWNNIIKSINIELELKSLFRQMYKWNISWENIVAVYVENLINKIHSIFGNISYSTCNQICEDVYLAAIGIQTLNNIKHSCQLKFKVFFELFMS